MDKTWVPNWGGVMIGLTVAGVAGGISAAIYEAAANGGPYVVFYGAVLAGLWVAVKSLFHFAPRRPDPVMGYLGEIVRAHLEAAARVDIDSLSIDRVTIGESAFAFAAEQSERTARLVGAAQGRARMDLRRPGWLEGLDHELYPFYADEWRRAGDKLPLISW